MEIKDDHIIPTRDVNKYYFYITEGGDIVLGFEKSKDYYFNKVIGNISDIKGKKIFLSDAVCTSIDEDKKVVKPTFFDMVMGILKVF